MSLQQGEKTEASPMPRAVIHKKILDAAKSHPDKTFGELATTVNGASEDLVKRVLDEYGDPVESAKPATDATNEPNENQSEMSNTKTNGAVNDESPQEAPQVQHESVKITDKQREALRAIRKHPDATQRDLADQFGVSQATINTRLNSIDGFDWEHRHEFVETMLDNNNSPSDDATPSSTSMEETATPSSVSIDDLTYHVADLAEQVQTLEQQVEDQSSPARSPFGDPDLASKMVRACMKDNNITEEEENQIPKKIITLTNPSE